MDREGLAILAPVALVIRGPGGTCTQDPAGVLTADRAVIIIRVLVVMLTTVQEGRATQALVVQHILVLAAPATLDLVVPAKVALHSVGKPESLD